MDWRSFSRRRYAFQIAVLFFLTVVSCSPLAIVPTWGVAVTDPEERDLLLKKLSYNLCDLVTSWRNREFLWGRKD
jgi:hypothetical protein